MASGNDFVHLHVHTDYSMLDGAARINALVAEAKALGQEAIAITDHGYLFGAYEFYSACKKAEIKPIIGLEAYMTPGTSRFDTSRVQWGTKDQQSAGDDVSARGAYTHITLLSRTTEGMHNLFRMGSLASLEGQLGKWPRIDRELLQNYAQGLIGTTGCPSGEISTRLRLGQWEEARRCAGELQDIFGKENYYVELMDHGLEIEQRVQKDLLRLAKDIGAKIIATNDSHYVKKDDRYAQDALLCLNSGSILSDPDRFRFDGSDYFLRPSHQMREVWAELPQACDNTLLIAEQCEVSFTTVDQGANFMPNFPAPPGEDEHSWFIKSVEKGLRECYGDPVPDNARKQAEYECNVITEMGFPGYFLVVADFVGWAKKQGIRVGPGRGSGPGSIVAYAMGITGLDPLEHGLIFERFLNPERISMPDFDVDFDERRRQEVFDYVQEKYGADRVAQVVTYGRIKAKQALKDSARVLGYPYSMGERLTKAMPPPTQGKDITVSGIFDQSNPRYKEAEEFRKLHKDDADVQRIVELAQGIEGLTRQWGVHACAVIMSSEPLQGIIPLMRRPQDGAIITQFDFPACEELGLLKMDFLGLKNLTIISDALDNIIANGKEAIDIYSLPLTDRATYELMGRADTLGVFQLDSGGMRTLLRSLRPTEFRDISAVLALFRPGPMGADSHTKYALRKNGQQKIDPIDNELGEALAPILDETYGLIVYQEQVMKIAQELAGYTLGQADILRKAMGKKKAEVMAKQFANFEAGMVANGFSKRSVQALWDVLVPFSDYAFNRSHTAAYGLLSYWTAYLKANYPTEYMAALLTSQKDNKDKLAIYLGECRHMGITVLPPDVNASAADFTPVGTQIRFGLAGVRNIGVNVVKQIIAARQRRTGFDSFQDFLDAVPQEVCNKRSIESLIKAGAFDSLQVTRRSLASRYEEAIDAMASQKKNEAKGQYDLFAALGSADPRASFNVEIPDLPEWNKKDKLAFEREMLGLYVSDHPLAGLETTLKRHSDLPIAQLLVDEDKRDGVRVTICGLITSIQRRTNKNGSNWAIVTVEDLSGSLEVLFFPQTYQTVVAQLQEDTIISVKGRLKVQDETRSILAMEMTVPKTVNSNGPIIIALDSASCTVSLAQRLREILLSHPGNTSIQLRLRTNNAFELIALSEDLRVDPNGAFFADIKTLLGTNCLVDQ